MAFKLSNGLHIVGWVSKDVLQREFWGFFLVLVVGVFLFDVGVLLLNDGKSWDFVFILC